MYPVFHPSPHINIPIYLMVMSLAFTVSVLYAYKRAIKLNLPPKISSSNLSNSSSHNLLKISIS